MDPKEYEILVSLFLLFSSFLVLAFRERRNPLIGFRVGYTYHSERVWKKVNTFSGIANALVSLFLLGIAFLGFPSTSSFWPRSRFCCWWCS